MEKKIIKAHIQYTREMMTGPGVLILIAGILLVIKEGFINNANEENFKGLILIFFAYLVYIINWNHKDLADEITDMKKRIKK